MTIFLGARGDIFYCWSPDFKEIGSGDSIQSSRQSFCDKNLPMSNADYQMALFGPTIPKEPPKEPPKGTKYDGEKLQWSLLPFDVLTDVVAVLMMGAKKYSPDNWKYVKPSIRYFDAAIRHLIAWKSGEKYDVESGKNHLAHAICCLIFLLWGDQHEEGEIHDAVPKNGTSSRVTPSNDGSSTDAAEVVRLNIPRELREKAGCPATGVGAG